jgi:predicted metalloendopeptidase
MTCSKRFQAFAAALAAGLTLGGAVGAEPASPASDVRPGDDFYAYANADWLKATTLPAGRSTYTTGAMLRALNEQRIAELVHAAAQPLPQRTRLQQQIGDYYASLVDTSGMDANGMAALSADLERIEALHDKRALSGFLGGAMGVGDAGGGPPDSVLGLWVHQGFSQSDRYLPHIQQGGLGLPSREAYLDAAADQAALRAKY